MASTTVESCIRWPQRIAGSQYWPRLIDSAPPATATSQSPSQIACEADTIACRPLPHSRFSVNAGVCTGSPPLIAATRARYMSRVSVWMTLPNTAWPTSAGATPARSTASVTTVAARSHGGTAARPPPYLPIAVRTPESTSTSLPSVMTPPSHVQAAVDGPDLAGDVSGLIRCQEADHPCDLARIAEPPHRNLAADAVQHLVRDGAEHVRRDVAGRHRVHGEPGTVTDRVPGPAQLEQRFP